MGQNLFFIIYNKKKKKSLSGQLPRVDECGSTGVDFLLSLLIMYYYFYLILYIFLMLMLIIFSVSMKNKLNIK